MNLSWRRLTKVTILVAVATAGQTASAGSEPDFARAHQLVTRANALASLGRAAGATALYRQALLIQRRSSGEVGYARYAHFRLAKLKYAAGDKKGARAELVAALAITAEQDRVRDGFHLERKHPFIVEHFPKLAGVVRKTGPTVRPPEPLLQLQPRRAATDRYLYAAGRHGVYRLDRRSNRVETIHDSGEAVITNFAVGPRGERLALTYLGDSKLYLVQRQPPKRHALTPPVAPRAFHLADDGRLIVYGRRGKYGLVGYKLPFGKPPLDPKPQIKVAGRWLGSDANRLIYARYELSAGVRFDPDRNPIFREVVVHDLAGAKKTLHRFDRPSAANRYQLLRSPSGQRFALFSLEAKGGLRSISVYDAESGKVESHPHSLALALPATEPLAAFSAKEDFLVVLERRRGALRVVRLSYTRGYATQLAALRETSPTRIYGLGVLEDNRTVWVHHGSDLVRVVAGSKRRPRRRKLAKIASLQRPRWIAPTRYLAGFGQFALTVAGKKQPRLVVIGKKKLR